MINPVHLILRHQLRQQVVQSHSTSHPSVASVQQPTQVALEGDVGSKVPRTLHHRLGPRPLALPAANASATS